MDDAVGEPVVDVVLGTGVFEGVRQKLLTILYGTADVGGCRAGVAG